jgi:hypothetical protein
MNIQKYATDFRDDECSKQRDKTAANKWQFI